MFDGAQSRRIPGPGAELAVIEAGDRQRPTLVFVHGYPDTKAVWSRVLERLADRFHVVAYDVRGAGESSAPTGAAAYSIEHLAGDLLAVIDATSPAAPVHLIGHDWGGIAGWEHAAMPRVSERLASFTTIAGPSLQVISDNLRRQVRGGHLLSAAAALRRSWYVLALCTPGVPRLAWRGLLGRGGWRMRLRYVERIPSENTATAPTLADDGIHGANLYRSNIAARLGRPPAAGRVPVPVQVLVPSGDHYISPLYWEGVERLAPGLVRRTLPGSHWAPLARPELIARWVGEFVEEVERGAVRTHPRWVRGGGEQQLAGRLALVTGAGSGIGRETARALAARGARLLLVDLSADAVAETAEKIPGSHTFVCDVADGEAMERLANRVLGEHGVPDIVVNNAGIGLAGSFMDHGFDDWRRLIDINLMGVVHGCRLFGEAMVMRGTGGHIVNTASMAAFTPTKDLPAYATSKAAVLMLSECLRAELVGHGIGVTAVCPGVVATNITSATRYLGRGESGQARAREEVTRLYQRRNYTPAQVAEGIVAAVASDTPVAVITPEAKLARVLSRIAPGVLRRLAALDTLPV